MKKLIAIAALSVCSLAIVSAKSYSISLSSTTKAGAVQLKAGQYKLKVEGSNAVFTEVNSSKSFTTPVKVENKDQKFDKTVVQTSKDGDTQRLDEIDLEGSTTKLGF